MLKLFKRKTSSNKTPTIKKFGTFQGVFTPTTLTILGVIMYLRHPWVVGNAGVLGAFLIVVIAVGITLATALSMSSITTNIRIGSGGAFSIIAQSLGLEMGGSIGIPLYFSQACAVAMYVFGFREGWLWIFPEHPALLVDVLTFGLVAAIAYISTDFAFKIQYVIMVIIVGSIVSILAGLVYIPLNINEFQWIGDFKGSPIIDKNSGIITGYEPADFWIVFAVFFPAVTGIMAGANMSGDLENPRRNIPVGTLTSVFLTGFIYIALIFVAAWMGTPQELTDNYTIFADKAIWQPIVIAGLLGATFSSALSSLVGAPRILLALGQKNILPGSSFFAQVSRGGEPRKALYFTILVVVLSLLLRDLNAIAPLITMFFMITYAMINVVVLIEQSLGLPSFRPTLKIPTYIPLFGTIGCLTVMFIINAVVSIIALVVVVTFYMMLLRKTLVSDGGDARSGLFTAMAEWATKQSNELAPKKEARAWQPELLIPVESPREIRGAYRLIYALTNPKGSIKILGLNSAGDVERLNSYLPELVQTFNKASISATYTIIDGHSFAKTVNISMQALGTAFFKPNTIFLKLVQKENLQEKILPILEETRRRNWGMLMFAPFEQVGLGIEKVVNVWIDIIPEEWQTELDLGNNDLSLLAGIIIRRNWNAKLNIIKTMREGHSYSEDEVRRELESIKTLARFPKDATVHVIPRDLEMWAKVPLADLNILEIPNKEDLDLVRLLEIPKKLRTACLFTSDSGDENALV